MQKLNKQQIKRMDKLLESNRVSDWDKQLLKGIKNNTPKNVSIADNTVLVDLIKKYGDNY